MTKRKSDFTLPTTSLDELFSSQEERDDAKLERVKEIPLYELHPFKCHPFKIQNDEEMKRLIESIQKFGTLTPALARPLPEGGYELISGHRRLAACQALGIETMPVIIREMSDDEAVVAMVDANLQREHILPSEKAFAYKMKLDAIKHQGRTVGTLCGLPVDFAGRMCMPGFVVSRIAHGCRRRLSGGPFPRAGFAVRARSGGRPESGGTVPLFSGEDG